MKNLFVVFGMFLGLVGDSVHGGQSVVPTIEVVNGDSTQHPVVVSRPETSSFIKIRIQEETPTQTPQWPRKKCSALATKFSLSTIKCGWTSCSACCEYRQLYDNITYFIGEHMCVGYTRAVCTAMRANAVRCASTTQLTHTLRNCFASWFDSAYPAERHRMVLVVQDTNAVAAWSTTGNSWGGTISNEKDERMHMFIHSK